MQQFVIGWLKLKPGKREEFMALAKDHEAATQKEDGCLFYEFHPSATDRDVSVLIESWKTAQHHSAHKEAPRYAEFGKVVGRLAVSGTFHEIEAAGVVTQRPEFEG